MKNKALHPIAKKILLFILSMSMTICLIPVLPLTAAEDTEADLRRYQDYRHRFTLIEKMADIAANGFRIIEDQVFPVELQSFGEVSFIPAMDTKYSRLAIFLTDSDGTVIYKTDQLETNNRIPGQLKQPIQGIAAVSFQDVNEDQRTDIVLITSCVNDTGTFAGKPYKVGDVLFQNDRGFYRDYRLSDKINRFSMNKSVEFITAFVRDGYSTEFLYTAATLDELLEHGFRIIPEQSYWRQFEKMGRLQVVPGVYAMADYHIFMIYLINEQGYIVWSFQPMGDYDNLYALKGITCKDIDGDGQKDMVVLARYSYEGAGGGLMIQSDWAIYYQRTGGFYADTEYKKVYTGNESETMAELIEKARAYWGWKVD